VLEDWCLDTFGSEKRFFFCFVFFEAFVALRFGASAGGASAVAQHVRWVCRVRALDGRRGAPRSAGGGHECCVKLYGMTYTPQRG